MNTNVLYTLCSFICKYTCTGIVLKQINTLIETWLILTKCYGTFFPTTKIIIIWNILNPRMSNDVIQAVNPVAAGKCRGRQQTLGEGPHRGSKAVCLLMHGDASFTGQGKMRMWSWNYNSCKVGLFIIAILKCLHREKN